MGKRFITARYPLETYSDLRVWRRLNEGDCEPHRMRPYGLESRKFSYRQLFEKKRQSRQGRKAIKRAEKKAARQWGKRQAGED